MKRARRRVTGSKRARSSRPPAAQAAAVRDLLTEGAARHRAGRLDLAEAAYRRALALAPDEPDALHLLGVIAHQCGQGARAEELILRAIDANPGAVPYHSNLGLVLHCRGRLDEAEAAYRQALRLDPGNVEALVNLANVLRDKGAHDEAGRTYARALERDPARASAHNNLGVFLLDRGRLGEAIQAFERSISLRPDHVEALANLGNAYVSQGRVERAFGCYRRALERRPRYVQAHSNLICAMHYRGNFTAAEIFAESQRWCGVHAAAAGARLQPHASDTDPQRRLRVGYVSPDLRTHSICYFFEPLLEAHDRGEVEVFCYAEVPNPDETSRRLESKSDHWRWTVGMSDEDVARQVRDDRIDVLVDLAGHTAGNRLLVFAEKPAPVQVSWLGYPGTTGLAEIDWRLTDGIADPPGDADHWHCERLVRLKEGFLCYAPPPNAPPPGEPPVLTKGRVTFASFNNLAKLTPQAVGLWARVLDALPTSRLVLKNRSLTDAGTRRLCEALFAEAGIDRDRLQLIGWRDEVTAHLDDYRQIDIALDTFPYNGTTTTCEALWMGVPVVTLKGVRHVERVGASLLSQIGLGDLIATSPEIYVAKAVACASDLPRLAALRDGLRARVEASPLGDRVGFARKIENAYREMWRAYCDASRRASRGARIA